MNNDLLHEQIKKDYQKVFETDEGKRVFGGIFHTGGLTTVQKRTDFDQGVHAMALTIANTLREVDPLAVARCEVAYQEMKEALGIGRDDSSE